MSDLILHHYPQSPFAEKMRLILGYKNLSWQSVLAPMIMPKPNLVALTGGYRRIPVLQIGADIYCDTALICDALEHRQPSPTLYPETQKGSQTDTYHGTEVKDAYRWLEDDKSAETAAWVKDQKDSAIRKIRN